MSYKYPRQRKKLFVFNGIFDDFLDTVFSNTIWAATYKGVLGSHSFVSAPGGAGGNALKLTGTITNSFDIDTTIGVSSYKNESFNYFFSVNAPLVWKVKAEFRLNIESDVTVASSTNKLSHCAGFYLDGNVKWETTTNRNRIGCYFNVASQKLGIAVTDTTNQMNAYTVSEVAWAGSYDTWYDIRIEYEYNHYSNPFYIDINIYVDNNLELSFSYAIIGWRKLPVFPNHIGSHQAILGRCGPGININQDVPATVGTVTAYFKDILITNDLKVIEYNFKNSIITPNADTIFTGVVITSSELMVSKSMDVQVYMRDSISDNWSGMWRGKINEYHRINRKMITIKAEGYLSYILNEKTDQLTFTTQTTATILAAAFNNPTKAEFDVSTYFDAVSATYTRTYIDTPKLDIIYEMLSLEKYLCFLDIGNNVHFQSYLTNELGLYQWGSDKIYASELSESHIRLPNFIRVTGSGVMAEREIPNDSVELGNKVTRTFSRLDLTTQSEVDDALNYYVAVYSEPIQLLTVKLRANYSLKIGYVIKLTIPNKQIYNREFLIQSIQLNHLSIMSVELLEVQPNLELLLVDFNKRTSLQESPSLAIDTLEDTDRFNVESTAKILVKASYEIEYNSVVVREGDMTVTNYCLLKLIGLWNNESLSQPDYIGYGTGTTEPNYGETLLVNETARTIIDSATKDERTGYSDPTDANFDTYTYRSIVYELDITNPVNMTEVGLFTAPVLSNMFARSVFTSYTQTGTVTIRITFRIFPVPSASIITIEGITRLIEWFYDKAATFQGPEISHLAHIGSPSFTAVSPYISGSTEGADVTICPALSTAGSVNKIKNVDRHLITIVFDYTYDYTTDKSAGSDAKEVGIAAILNNSYVNQWSFIMFRRTPDLISTKDGFSCKWILNIKYIRGHHGFTN